MRFVPTLTRGLALIAATTALSGAVACAVDASDHAESTSSTGEDLYGLGTIATKWPNGVVPVCFKNINAQTALQAQIPGLLANSWGAAANITFTGFGACSGTGNKVTVTFAVSNPSCSSNSQCGDYDQCSPGGSCVGYRGSTVGIGYGQPVVTLISDDASPNQTRFKYEVLHEFGHVLGFVHEQQRPDNWVGDAALQCQPPDGGSPDYSPIDGGLYLTPTYDTASIMNYCEPLNVNDDLLSPGDISGVSQTAAYGPSIAPKCSPQAQCDQQWVPASNGVAAHYQTFETVVGLSCASNISSFQQFTGGTWVTLPAFVSNLLYPTVGSPGEGVLGTQSNGVTTSGASIGAAETVRACATNGTIVNCDPPTTVHVIDCCTPLTADNCDGFCGSMPDGCGGSIQCGGCPAGDHCTNNICMKCSTVENCPSGTYFNTATCSCARDFCACGGIYPKCTVCQ
jgi:hypothetical protein